MKRQLNVKLLRQAAKNIVAEAEHFDMNSWVEAEDICDTTCCIAGRIVCDSVWAEPENKAKSVEEVIYMVQEVEYGHEHHPKFSDVRSYAQELLGISEECGENLWFVENWPEPFMSEHRRAKTRLAKAKVAAARIEHFIATGE